MEGGRDRGIGEKSRKYIFMFAGMSASASIPNVAVIGKVRRGDSGTQPGQGERGPSLEAFQRRGEMMWLLLQVVNLYFLSVECVCVCMHTCFIDPNRVYVLTYFR